MNARTFSRSGLLAALLMVFQASALATPPSHAPAHGWRKQHDPGYQGYTGKTWDKDYGILAGTCNRDAVGAVVGAVVGGAVGSQIGKGDGNKVAIVVGATLGALIGAKVGRDMDRTDAACIGHALELARDGQKVSWKDAEGVAYRLKPLQAASRNGLACRTFELTVAGKTRRGEACQTAPGTWEVR